MALNNEIINKKVFLKIKPLKFFMGTEFQRKEYCHWCDKIEEHGGIIYETIDRNTINLTKDYEANKYNHNYDWYDCQFINDCIENSTLIDIENYRITKMSNEIQPAIVTSKLSSPPPKKIYKSSKDTLISTDKKLKMNTAVQLKSINLPYKNKSINEKNKKIITSTNNNDKNQLNLSANKTPGFTKGITIVDIVTVKDSTFNLSMKPIDKSKNTKNSANKKCLNDPNGTSDKSSKQKIDNKPVKESLNNINKCELLIDNLSVTDDSSNNFMTLKKLSNKISNSRLTSVKNKTCKKKNTNKFREQSLVLMTTSSDDEENISSFKKNNKIIL